MRGIAYLVLAMVFLANFFEPLLEIMECTREKVVISAALNNAFRAARDRSLTEESLREQDAQVDESIFVEYFAETFADDLELNISKLDDTSAVFYGNDRFNSFEINFQIYDDSFNDKEMTRIDVQLQTKYMFKTKIMKVIEDSTQYSLEMNETYLLWVKN